MQTVTRKRIEILADAPLVPRVVAALKQAGIRGHTVLPALSGTGRSGDWRAGRLTGSTQPLRLAPPSVAALKQAGIRGHTVLPALSGTGRSGDWSEERLTGSTKQIVLALASEANAQAFVDLAGTPLDTHH